MGIATLPQDRFADVFGDRRGTVHDPLVEAALARIPTLTNHLDGCDMLRLALREACIELEEQGSNKAKREALPILMMTGAPGEAREAVTISVRDWLGEGYGYPGWKACLELVRGEARTEVRILFAEVPTKLESLDTGLIIGQVAHALVHDWEWTREAIGAPDIA
jgi:hypothetical protein